MKTGNTEEAQMLLYACVSYISVAGTKYHDHSKLEKEELIWAYTHSQRDKSPLLWVGKPVDRQGGQRRKQRNHIFKYKQEAEDGWEVE